MIDLFGNDTTPVSKVEHGKLGKYQLKKLRMGYSKSMDERKCKACVHCIHKEFHNKNYYKCELIGNSGCDATDVRLNSVCKLFVKDPK